VRAPPPFHTHRTDMTHAPSGLSILDRFYFNSKSTCEELLNLT
jgi:hypothetical protein